MTAKEFIVAKIKQIRDAGYKPMFAVGDIIINTKFKILSRVNAVNNRVNPITKKDEPYEYVLKDLQHSLKTEASIKRNMRYKEIIKIDYAYEKVDPNAAEILYGVKKDGK